MELTQYMAVARRWWWLLLVAVVIGGGSAYYLTSQQTTTYTATTRLLVLQQTVEGVTQINDINTSERLAFTFANLVTLRPVLEEAIATGGFDLSAREFERLLEVTNPRDTMFLDISATEVSEPLAISYVNTLAETFIGSEGVAIAQEAGIVNILEDARDAEANKPSVVLNSILGVVIAFVAAAALALALDAFDSRIRLPGDVLNRSGLPTVGHIERFGKRKSSDGLEVVRHPTSRFAEEFRAIRTNLSARVDLNRDSVQILIASPTSGDGKTTVAANLALVFGFAGRRVVLVDADLRNPRQHKLFGVGNEVGLTTFLNSPDPDLASVVQRTDQPNVSILTAGPIPTNPSELLGSLRMNQLVDELSEAFDVVLFDSPPLLSVTDGTVLAGIVSGSVLVLRPNKTEAEELGAAVDALSQGRRPIYGVVFNQVQGSDFRLRHAYGDEQAAVTERLRTADLAQRRINVEPRDRNAS